MAGLGKKPAVDVLEALLGRLDDARDALEADAPLEKRVHDARRKLKKARACLRLLRAAVSSKERRAVNALCRDAGRALGAARDGAALERAWQALGVEAPGGGVLLQRRLEAERGLQEGDALADCLDALRKARKRGRRLSLDGRGWQVLAQGLQTSCERFCSAFREAQRLRTDAAYHEWRKRAKDLRYQLELLDRPERRSIGRVVELLKQLTDLLGDDHDLAELGALVAGASDAFGGVASARRVDDAIMRKRRALRRAALALGRRWTPDQPRELAARARQSWQKALNLKE